MLQKRLSLFTNNKLILIALFVLALYLSPMYILGENSHVRIHDNLDSNVVWYKILAESGQLFGSSDTKIPNIMNGLPRDSLGSEFNVIVWLYCFFEPFTAYRINITLMRIFAFLGMYVLLKRYYIKEEKEQFIAVFVALGFSLIPFWPSGGLSIAGLPLVLYAFMNFRSRQATYKDWLIILLVPFYSSFVLSYFFFLTLIGIWWIVDTVRNRRANWLFFASIVVMIAMFLLVEYRLVLSMFFSSSYVSHRKEFALGFDPFPVTVALFFKNVVLGHTHVSSMQFIMIIPSILIACGIMIYKRVWSKNLLKVVALILSISAFYAFWYNENMRVLKDAIPLMNEFNFSRFQFLNPLFWYIAFALALVFIARNVEIGKGLAVLLLVAQLVGVFNYNDEVKYRSFSSLSYAEFYSTSLFTKIKKDLGDPSQYRIVTIGMHPAIPEYNGFYTLDGYVPNYPLSYKHQFRQIIAQELYKNPYNRDYFDNWGSRCYIFTNELGTRYMYTKDRHKTLKSLQLNTHALKQMGGKYVFSAVPIENAKENNLTFHRSYTTKTSPWRVYVYQVD